MSFWDEPANLPPSASLMEGQSLQGAIAMRVQNGQYGQRLKYTINGVERWASMSLWKTLATARIEPGDHVRITRQPDTPSGSQQWTVERLQAAPRTTEAQPAQATAGPTW